MDYAVAAEILQGLASKQRGNFHIFFGKTAAIPTPKETRSCKVCNKDQHPLWRCNQFKSKSVEERWSTAKRLGVCYRCLRGNHKGYQCTREGVCGENGCQERHDRLLHKDQAEKPANNNTKQMDSHCRQATSSTEGNSNWQQKEHLQLH